MRKKQIFLSHAWGIDELGRNNHHRVKELAHKLRNHNYSVWFDDDDMIGNIDKSIIEGINKCDIVIFCLTTKYSNKINNSIINNIPNDNCYKEWNYTLFCKKKILPAIMESSMQDNYTNKKGALQMYLNNTLYIDFSQNLEDNFDKLLKTLHYYQIYPYINIYSFDKKYYYQKLNKSKSLPNMNSFILSSQKSTKSLSNKRRTFIKL